MNWNQLFSCFPVFPSFEEGWPRRSSEYNATLDSARPGRSNAYYKKTSDLPRCALIKVARHLFVGRSAPSSKEGKQLFPIHSHLRSDELFSRAFTYRSWTDVHDI